jgi:hypothetical protein
MAYESLVIWCELNAGDESFTIKDKDRNKKYHVVSSTIGVDKASGTDVALASNYRFKVYFPAIKDELNNIDIVVTEPYMEEFRIYDNTKDDGLHNVIGSGNQEVWIPAKNIFYKAGDLASMTLNENNELEVKYK